MNECSKCDSTYSVLTVSLENKDGEVVSRKSLCLKCLRAFRKENRQANLLRSRGKKLKITLNFSRSQTHAALNLRRGEFLAR
jgi:hypothetical protein